MTLDGPAFVQKSSVQHRNRRNSAAQILLTVAKKVKDPKLAALGTQVHLAGFAKVKRVGEDRQAANKEFQQTVADQRATQELLEKALGVLSGFYDKKAVLVQTEMKTSGKQPAPPGFKSYEKSNISGGVMGMMKQIIADAKAMEAEAISNESDAAAAYQDFVKQTNDSITQKNQDMLNKEETKAQAEADKAEADTNLEGVLSELQMLANKSADLHSSCDFILKNFDIRQGARDDEIEALKQSIAILSGATLGFMQKHH